MKLPDAWRIVDEKDAASFERELQREAPASHALYKKTVRCVARRIDRDDFAFECLGESQYAKVHLTWQKETDSRWPHVDFYESLQALFADDEDVPLNPYRRQ